jgi:extracellular factor (EF) 3-hydroxypalmitic acid methyl ester biosynthesis protein
MRLPRGRDKFRRMGRALVDERLVPQVAATLSAAVEQFKSAMLALDRDLLSGPRGDTDESMAQLRVSDACATVVDDFRRHIAGGDPDEDGSAAYLFRETFPYFSMSRLIDRSYAKPRGYAGDYLTIEMVYKDRAAGVRRLGSYIDRWFLDIPASCAVKNRRRLLADTIAGLARTNGGAALHVTSIASGPARELFDVLAADRDGIDLHATCLDVDAEALAYTSAAASHAQVSDRFRFVHANAVKVALGRDNVELGEQDLMYSVGLIDYLRDDLVVALLDWIHDRLRPGGTVIVGNFDVANPDKAFMDHLLEWRLIHRTSAELEALFRRSKFADTPLKVCTEATGINLFASTQRG